MNKHNSVFSLSFKELETALLQDTVYEYASRPQSSDPGNFYITITSISYILQNVKVHKHKQGWPMCWASKVVTIIN
jgi:hypothetical protein